MDLTRNPKTGLISVHAPEFMAFLHRRGDPCPLFPWDGQEPLEVHHLGAPDARGFWMRRENDGLGILIPRSVHARSQQWEAQDGGRLLAAAVAYALADFLEWLLDPADDEPRLGDPLPRIVNAALGLAHREAEVVSAVRAWAETREAAQHERDLARFGVRPGGEADVEVAEARQERAERELLALLAARTV